MAIAYLSLGSNKGDRIGFVQQATSLLNAADGISLIRTSAFYESEPWGMDTKNWFVNAVVEIKTTLSPQRLLNECQRIEAQLGRKRDIEAKGYQDRTIDIDILFYSKEIVNDEIFRQRDKSNNNDIGYFHQNIFSYFKGCEVPQAGWDVIYRNPDGIQMPDGDIVHTIYVEMKNKHNTMNSASSAKTYIKMQGQILEDDDCACLLVEAIAKKSQNIKWSTKVDGKNVQHRLIRRVSMDQFYAILTGEEDAFYKMCMALPEVINSVVNEEGGVEVPHDTVIDELRKVASLYGDENGELSMAMAVYMLGFNTYMGFGDKIRGELGEDKDGMLKRIYEYVKRLK